MIIYGHRGARFEAPENTVAGFRYAAGLGLPGVELDVRMSRDGQLVIIHDAAVDRTTDGTGEVSDLDLDELRRLDARAELPDWPDAVRIPTFVDMVEATADFATVEVELKRDGAGRDAAVLDVLVASLEGTDLPERAMFTSFHADLLLGLAARRPDLRLAFIGRYDHPGWIELARRVGAVRACIQHEHSSADLVRTSRSAGLEVLGWPCNTAADLERVTSWGVDGVTTDAPSLIAPLAAAG